MSPRSEKFVNPFYGLLLAVGLAFLMTAICYGVMAFRKARPPLEVVAAASESQPDREHPLLAWMSQHGEATLLTELAFLAIFTFAAIGTDDYWQRRAQARQASRK
ncbi:MAG: hypothetical protein IT425_09685 [Pirellulales bacterium]|nr:hypothetical protein [Pirellulales bacterium]